MEVDLRPYEQDWSQANEDYLSSVGKASRIHRGKPKGKANTRKSVVRSKVGHVFAGPRDQMGLFIRTIGIDAGLHQDWLGQHRLQHDAPNAIAPHGPTRKQREFPKKFASNRQTRRFLEVSGWRKSSPIWPSPMNAMARPRMPRPLGTMKGAGQPFGFGGVGSTVITPGLPPTSAFQTL